MNEGELLRRFRQVRGNRATPDRFIGTAPTRPMRRILLIDDEAWFRAPAALMLRNGGYHVDCAASADEALKLLESIHPDLILLDLMMPGMSGLTFLRLIRADERFAALVVVVLSAWADGQPGTDALALGAKACLVKGSFSLLDLTQQLEMLAPVA